MIALAHMRVHRQKNLAKEVPEIDLILGGHDHIYYCDIVHDVFVLTSGTDFENFSDVKLQLNID